MLRGSVCRPCRHSVPYGCGMRDPLMLSACDEPGHRAERPAAGPDDHACETRTPSPAWCKHTRLVRIQQDRSPRVSRTRRPSHAAVAFDISSLARPTADHDIGYQQTIEG